MSSRYAIEFDESIPEFEREFCGRALLQKIADVDWTARELAVRPLSEFCSPALFSAEEGLQSVTPLIREIDAWVVGPGETDALLHELRTCEIALSAAKLHGTTWHFRVVSEHEPKG